MGNVTYASRLRYLDAEDVDDAVVDYDGLDVYGRDGNKIGDVDGFIVDQDATRVNYVVVDSGGWFTSRRLLLPIGHATLAADRKSLQADVTREALRRLPEFDADRFHAFSDEELRAFERNTVLACCPDEPLEDVSVASWGYDARRHYAQPEWWRGSRYAPERLRPIETAGIGRTDPTVPIAATAATAATRDTRNRDLVTARENQERDRPGASPHLDGRAQPGDVLGIETGGERTGIGDTAEDEDDHRRAGERAARKGR
jgi:PRC-barrel domain